MTSTTSRSARALVPAAALALVLAACGGGDGGGGGEAGGDQAERLTAEQATSALLTADNVGDVFEEQPEDDDEDEGGLGCLDAVAGDDADDAPVSEERYFEAQNDFETPTIGHNVASYDAVEDAEAAKDRFAEALEGCTEVDEVDDEGTRTRLELETQREVTDGLDVDDQVSVEALGDISSEGFELPVGFWFSAVRVDNHVSLVFVADLDTSFGENLDDYVEVATARVRAVVDGEEPPTTFVDAGVEGGTTGGA